MVEGLEQHDLFEVFAHLEVLLAVEVYDHAEVVDVGVRFMHCEEGLDLLSEGFEVGLGEFGEGQFAEQLLDFDLVGGCVDGDGFGFERCHGLHYRDQNLLLGCHGDLAFEIQQLLLELLQISGLVLLPLLL